MHTGHYQQRPECAHNGHGQPAQIAVNGVDQRRNRATNPDTQRPNQHNRQRGGNQHDQHRFQEVFGDRWRDLVHPAFDVRQAPGHDQRRDHRVGVFHCGHRDKRELDVLALGGFRHQLDKAWMNQHARDGNR
ncbi:hypothetical protein D3C71_1615930 [compost metagenome]